MEAASAAWCVCECRMLFTLAFATNAESRDNMYSVRLENGFTSFASVPVFLAVFAPDALRFVAKWCEHAMNPYAGAHYSLYANHTDRGSEKDRIVVDVNSQLSNVNRPTDIENALVAFCGFFFRCAESRNHFGHAFFIAEINLNSSLLLPLFKCIRLHPVFAVSAFIFE